MTESDILEKFRNAVENLSELARQELEQQGHKATGSLINSIEPVLRSEDIDNLIADIMANDYGNIVDTGVKASRIPYGGNSRGATSKYIQALIDWAKIVKPSLDEKERKSFVFAVAKKQSKEGMPTRGSYNFSKNNRRKNWIKFGIAENVNQLEKDLELESVVREILEKSVLIEV